MIKKMKLWNNFAFKFIQMDTTHIKYQLSQISLKEKEGLDTTYEEIEAPSYVSVLWLLVIISFVLRNDENTVDSPIHE